MFLCRLWLDDDLRLWDSYFDVMSVTMMTCMVKLLWKKIAAQLERLSVISCELAVSGAALTWLWFE